MPASTSKIAEFAETHDAINPPLQTLGVPRPGMSNSNQKEALASMKLPLPASKYTRPNNSVDQHDGPVAAPSPGNAMSNRPHLPPTPVPGTNPMPFSQGHHTRVNMWDANGTTRDHGKSVRQTWDERSTVGSLFSESEEPTMRNLAFPQYENQARPPSRRSSDRDPKQSQAPQLSKAALDAEAHQQFAAPPLRHHEVDDAAKPKSIADRMRAAAASVSRDPFNRFGARSPVADERHRQQQDVVIRSVEDDGRHTPLGRFHKQSTDRKGRREQALPLGGIEAVPEDDEAPLRPHYGNGRLFDHFDESPTRSVASDTRSRGDESEQERTPKARKRPGRAEKTASMMEAGELGMLTKKSMQRRPIPPPSPSPERTAQKQSVDLDYDETALAMMSYAQLQKEPFEKDPQVKALASPARVPGNSLHDKMMHYRNAHDGTQLDFFKTLSVDDWESCGDWFLEQFGAILKQAKDARQAKRKVVQDFEHEVANREEIIRTEKDSIDRRLLKFKADCGAMIDRNEEA